MILRIIVVAALLIAAVLVFAAMKPNTFHLQRAITIKAPPEKIFPLINDFHNWSAWEPQDKDAASIQRSYSGPAAGVGAVSEWQGTGSTGKGRRQITESVSNSKVSVAVDFVKPFQAHNINVFTLQPAGDSTTVTWNFEGTNVFVLKLMNIFVSMDRIMGSHFETGLENLKSAAER
jgi:carbon monoxide dehydrogenase subunit G